MLACSKADGAGETKQKEHPVHFVSGGSDPIADHKRSRFCYGLYSAQKSSRLVVCTYRIFILYTAAGRLLRGCLPEEDQTWREFPEIPAVCQFFSADHSGTHSKIRTIILSADKRKPVWWRKVCKRIYADPLGILSETMYCG